MKPIATIERIPFDLIMTTDSYLDRLFESFERLKIRRLLGLSYAQYMKAPDKYDELAQFLLEGNAFQVNDRSGGLLLLEMPGAAYV